MRALHKRSSNSTICWTFLFCLFAGLAIRFFGSWFSHQISLSRAERVDAKTFSENYNKDPVAVRHRYGGKLLVVTGVVTSKDDCGAIFGGDCVWMDGEIRFIMTRGNSLVSYGKIATIAGIFNGDNGHGQIEFSEGEGMNP